ncbi:hypothetical protein MMC17_001761 [Xylographa soralifera]|nr:hypothetical protein [Xylographa soralifera]
MSSDTSRAMLPPPKPPQRRFAPALAIKKPSPDPYDPQSLLTEEYSFLKHNIDDESLHNTWTTIDTDTGVRNWDQNHRRGNSNHDSQSLSTISSARGGSIRSGNVWDSWAGAPATKLADCSQTAYSPSVSSTGDNQHIADVDDDVRSHFVDISSLMKENQRPLTDFERRNQSVLYQGSMEKLKNVVGDRVVSVTHQPIDERLQYLDENGKYRDGIDRGPIKKRLMEEWHKRLADRTAEMEHVTRLKREWDALPDSEKTRRMVQREANTKLLTLFGAGLESTNDLATYEGEELPEIYRRVSRWTISDHGSVSDGPRSQHVRSLVIEGPHPKVQRKGRYMRTEPAVPVVVRDVSIESTSGMSDSVAFEGNNVGVQSPSHDFAFSAQGSSTPASEQYGSNPDSVETPRQIQELHQDDRTNARRGSWEPQEPRRRPLPGKRKRSERPPSTITSRIYSPSPRPTQSSVRSRPRISSSVNISSKPSSSVTSETTVIFDCAPDIAILEDLPERTDFDDRWGAEARFDKIDDASTKHGRVVMVRLHEPVVFTSSAISERLFGGGIQEIQYHPAERMALVVFLFPSEAGAMVKHVKNIRENNAHEYRRLQIDAEWYKGLETKAVYPAQAFTLATMLVEGASRIVLVTHVSVLKKTQDFAQDMKTSFPDKIIVKAAISKPTKRYVQERDGNSGILEFASIKDAFEVMEVFKNNGVLGYEGSTVEWLQDSCDVAKPALPYCDCLMCNGTAMKLVQGV